MTRKNKYAPRARLSEAQLRQFLRYFAADLNVDQIARLTGLNRSTVNRYLRVQKTVAKWKKRSSTLDRKTGPSEPKSTLLSGEEEAVVVAFRHIFDQSCDENGIERRVTTIKHPWTSRQVERVNRTIEKATVKRFHCGDHAQLRRHLAGFIDAYNFGRRLKTLRSLTPYELICQQ